MTAFRMRAAVLAAGLAFAASAVPQSMSKDDYQSEKTGIAADYKAAKAACNSVSGNAKDICKALASGKEKTGRAELEARFRPSVDTTYRLRLARAEADYAVSRERCDDSAGNVKDICVEEAKAAAVAAKADAKAKMKTNVANDEAAATSARANHEASDRGAEARRDAATEKRDADYAVAKQRCDGFAGDAKSNCMNEAKARFGKS